MLHHDLPSYQNHTCNCCRISARLKSAMLGYSLAHVISDLDMSCLLLASMRRRRHAYASTTMKATRELTCFARLHGRFCMLAASVWHLHLLRGLFSSFQCCNCLYCIADVCELWLDTRRDQIVSFEWLNQSTVGTGRTSKW